MKSIPAREWNALIDQLRRDQLIGCTVLEVGAWRHPWHVSPEWNPDRLRWEARIQPGFVNGLDAEVRVAAKDAPAETLRRLKLTSAKAAKKMVDAWLTEDPRMPLDKWRAIGRDAQPESVSAVGGDDINASYEPVPDFFLALGAAEHPKSPLSFAPTTGGNTRLLRATEITLQKDRITTGTDWTFGTGVDGTFAQFNVTYRLPAGAKKRAYLRSVAKLRPPTPGDPMARLMGDWESDPFDTIPVATVYLLSPENAIQNSEPGPDWSPYVKHHVFWNLIHDVTIQPPAGSSENMTLPTGLALGVADGVVNQILATVNDKNAALTEFLGKRTVEGRFWTI
jgi:hypothetical protein